MNARAGLPLKEKELIGFFESLKASSVLKIILAGYTKL
jgi:hypothetical protein